MSNSREMPIREEPLTRTRSLTESFSPPRSSILAKFAGFQRAASVASSEDSFLTTPSTSPSLDPVRIVDPETLDNLSEINPTLAKKQQHVASGARRSSWSTPNDTVTSPTSVMGWLQNVTESPVAKAPSSPEQTSALLRRFSLSSSTPATSQQRPTKATLGGLRVEEQAVAGDSSRVGRPLERVTSNPTRRLSPMGQRMLTGQFY